MTLHYCSFLGVSTKTVLENRKERRAGYLGQTAPWWPAGSPSPGIRTSGSACSQGPAGSAWSCSPPVPTAVPIESLRLRFALLQSLNTTLETFFLPLVELRQTPAYTRSIAALLEGAKGQCWLGQRDGACAPHQ